MPRLHRGTTVVLALSLLSTAAGVWFTRDLVARSEQRLLQQKAAEAGMIMSSLMSQSYGAAGAALAGTLQPDGSVNEKAFQGIAAMAEQASTDSGQQSGLGLSGVALLDLARGRVLAKSGTADPDPARVKGQLAGSTELVFTGLAESAGHRTLGMAVPAGPTLAAYLEMPIEGTVSDVDLLPGQPFAGLDFAIYIGSDDPSHLMWTNKPGGLSGRTAQVFAGANAMDTFGSQEYDASRRPMLIRLASPGPQTGRYATWFPWITLTFGLCAIAAIAALLEKTARRRDEAVTLVAELERRNDEVQDAVTQRIDAEERLRQSQRLEAVGQLAGGIAHDFNNLLAVILSYAGFLKTTLHAHPALEDVEEIDKAAHRAADLTQQLLMFSRREPVRPGVVDLRALVADRERLLRRTLSEDIDLVIDLPPGPAAVVADAGELDQVLMNLVVNARDAMPNGGRLSLVVTEVPAVDGRRDVQLVVADNGSGMAAEVVDHAFEPFFTTKEVGRGTGLGLATVYGIVTRWGGEVRLSSTPGRGTSVTVQLPSADAPVADAPEERAPEPAGQSGRVLLVEDEEGVRRAAERILSEAGFEVVVATTGQEALELFTHCDEVDVVVSDVVMPGGTSGPDLAEHVRVRCPDMPVVLTTGHSRDHLPDRGPLPAGTHLLHKPFTAATLVETVRECLDDRRARRASV